MEGVSGTLAVEWLFEVREQKPPWNEVCSGCRKGYRNRLGCKIMQLNVRWARILCAGSRFLHCGNKMAQSQSYATSLLPKVDAERCVPVIVATSNLRLLTTISKHEISPREMGHGKFG